LKSNKRIEELLGNDEIRIHKIDQCIMIDKKEGVSQGQSLAVAYAFLATLFEDSSHKVPFVIDSPAGSLDLEVRREVSNLIPQLFPQLVVFILSSERDGFVDGLAEKYDDIQYYTIFKDPSVKGGVLLDNNVDFFMNFHSETEAT
jgi:wobble nucleotide-excising tRNase